MLETIIRNFTFDKIWYIIKKRWAIVVMFAVIGAAVGGVFAQSQSSSLYRARVSFYLFSRSDYTVEADAYVNSSDFAYATKLINSYILVLKSNSVLEKVIENTGLNISVASLSSKIGVAVEKDTALFYVYVSDSDPYTAMLLANSLAEVAPDEVSRIVKSGGINVVDYATLPTAPYTSTNVLKFIALGAAAGFAVPFAIVMLAGLLDTTIRKKNELENMFEIPIIGDVPYISGGTKKNPISKILTAQSPFAITEAYNSLCTNLLYTAKGESCPVYAVTSAVQNEGKSLNSINMARDFALLGKKTLLIDADMRNASVSRYLERDEEEGLSQYLASITDKLNIISIDERFDVLFAGKQPPNPAELLANNRIGEMLEKLKKEYDFIFIDVPPVGIVTDALLLRNNIVGYIFVVRAGYTKMTDATATINRFEKADANVSGFLFNSDSVKGGSYRKYNQYGYGDSKRA